MGRTALMLASERGHVEIVQLLTKRMASLNVNNNVSANYYLQQHFPEIRLQHGWTALLIASAHGQADVVEYLLSSVCVVDIEATSHVS